MVHRTQANACHFAVPDALSMQCSQPSRAELVCRAAAVQRNQRLPRAFTWRSVSWNSRMSWTRLMRRSDSRAAFLNCSRATSSLFEACAPSTATRCYANGLQLWPAKSLPISNIHLQGCPLQVVTQAPPVGLAGLELVPQLVHHRLVAPAAQEGGPP